MPKEGLWSQRRNSSNGCNRVLARRGRLLITSMRKETRSISSGSMNIIYLMKERTLFANPNCQIGKSLSTTGLQRCLDLLCTRVKHSSVMLTVKRGSA